MHDVIYVHPRNMQNYKFIFIQHFLASYSRQMALHYYRIELLKHGETRLQPSVVKERLRHPLWSINLANGVSQETPCGLLAVNRSNFKVGIVSCTICLGFHEMTTSRNKLTAGYFSFAPLFICLRIYFLFCLDATFFFLS